MAVLVAVALPGCLHKSSVAQGAPNPIGQVMGIYDYRGTSALYGLRGTITFEQEMDVVRVLTTTYANAPDRSLKGEATIVGDTLTINLVPVNGQTDFNADCIFVFNADRSTFEVQFDDTNGDNGPLGSYIGQRR